MKFELTSNTKVFCGTTLYQIKALISFGAIKKGDLGGYVEKVKNLSQSGDAWVSGDALVYGNAQVSGDAMVYGDANVYGKNIVSLLDNVTITDKVKKIGCEFHSIDEWASFSDVEIENMDYGALNWWNDHKELIIGLAKANSR